MMCKDTCSQHCQDPRSCDHITGTCVGGCRDGWIGSKCTESKPFSILQNACIFIKFYVMVNCLIIHICKNVKHQSMERIAKTLVDIV